MKILSLFLLILLAGCATSATRTNRLAVGMTKEEAIGVMGTPVVSSAVGETEYLEYRVAPGSIFRERTPFVIALRNGRVTAFGHPFNIEGPPREEQPASSPAAGAEAGQEASER
jgi:hypothetical protein